MINLKEARSNATKALDNKELDKEAEIKKKSEEFLEVADSFIEKASTKGESSTSLCIAYDLEDYEMLYKSSRRAARELDSMGYTSKVSENSDIKTILLYIEWDC